MRKDSRGWPPRRPQSVIQIWGEDGDQILGGEMVFEDDDGPIDTGLVDACGKPIYRRPKRLPIGFDLSKRKP